MRPEEDIFRQQLYGHSFRTNYHRQNEHDFAAFKTTDHVVVGDETNNNSANLQSLVVENKHMSPPEEPELHGKC
ncbi:hypothetical protein TNCV_1966991 [Trichonephila clavipes]|nr:hypothetical protein TNCV_1966991 [Trichonephila clavipes]